MVQRLKVTHFYTAPTAIRMLITKGDEWVKKYDRSSLRILGCGKILNTNLCLQIFMQNLLCCFTCMYTNLLLHAFVFVNVIE